MWNFLLLEWFKIYVSWNFLGYLDFIVKTTNDFWGSNIKKKNLLLIPHLLGQPLKWR